jgi:hypothetical protein
MLLAHISAGMPVIVMASTAVAVAPEMTSTD